MMMRQGLVGLLFMLSCMTCEGFMAPGGHLPAVREASQSRLSTSLQMGLDMVTYMRVEWIAAALVTNQTPNTADVCLQIGCEDGRGITFVPRTIEKLITSTVEPDGMLPLSVRRQLLQQEKTRNPDSRVVKLTDQRADDLKETPDESVDIVISLAACARMIETGLDWKKSVQESARVLKPGGRLLFVEQNDLQGDSYLDYLANLSLQTVSEDGDGDDELFPVFEPLGYDDVDLVLVPHVAGVVVKSADAGLTNSEREAKEKNAEKDKMADISILAYERGIKKRRRKKKDPATEEEAKK
jgi:ubiquinone/menaquinone biosynthesis C-methylase UbiE